ncbi:hypothetical protein ABZ883_02965 [Streptomyces sp. NPDC046977]|uniref:hypothetical protein n=1 Tax=Streptomyces sp. NPDC046977 TaxID=3154703 RepID=UPI0033D2E298
MTTTQLDRARAVKRIADHLADQDSFVLAISARMLAPLAPKLGRLVPTWAAYLDTGEGQVTRTDHLDTLRLLANASSASVVVTIPKTVPATAVGEVFAIKVQVDGLRDFLDLDRDYWPALMFDALEGVDPVSARVIRARYPEPGRPRVTPHGC